MFSVNAKFAFSQITLYTSVSFGNLKYFENGVSSILFEQNKPILDKRSTTPDNLFVVIILVLLADNIKL